MCPKTLKGAMNGRAKAIRNQFMKHFDEIKKKPKDRTLLADWYKENKEVISR